MPARQLDPIPVPAIVRPCRHYRPNRAGRRPSHSLDPKIEGAAPTTSSRTRCNCWDARTLSRSGGHPPPPCPLVEPSPPSRPHRRARVEEGFRGPSTIPAQSGSCGIAPEPSLPGWRCRAGNGIETSLRGGSPGAMAFLGVAPKGRPCGERCTRRDDPRRGDVAKGVRFTAHERSGFWRGVTDRQGVGPGLRSTCGGIRSQTIKSRGARPKCVVTRIGLRVAVEPFCGCRLVAATCLTPKHGRSHAMTRRTLGSAAHQLFRSGYGGFRGGSHEGILSSAGRAELVDGTASLSPALDVIPDRRFGAKCPKGTNERRQVISGTPGARRSPSQEFARTTGLSIIDARFRRLVPRSVIGRW